MDCKKTEINPHKDSIYSGYFTHIFYIPSIISHTLFSILLFSTSFLLFSAPTPSGKNLMSDLGSHSPKELTLKLKRYLENSISASLDRKSWKKAMELLAQAEQRESGGEVKKAQELYIEAGKILLSIDKKHPYRQLSESKITLGQITLDKKSQTISFPAKITYNKDMPVEVILSTPNAYRSYETLFTSTINPLHLQTILYLAGYMNGVRTADNQGSKQGDHLFLYIQNLPKDGSKIVTKPVGDFLRVYETGEVWKPKYWVFVGSKIDQGQLVAERTGESILSWCVASTIIEPSDDLVAKGDHSLSLCRDKAFPDKSDVIFIILPSAKDKKR